MFKRYFYTIIHLKPHQIYYRIFFTFLKPRPSLKAYSSLSKPNKEWRFCGNPRQIIDREQITFLNESYSMNAIDWNSQKASKLWMYNLHYFDFLYANHQEEARNESLIDHWIDHNPPANGIAWDSYPTSLRIVNWIKWCLAGNINSTKILDSLYLQSDWLSKRVEHHIEGNHLFANGKALLFAGLFFSSFQSAKFKKMGLKILQNELTKQVLEDGGHFELSPMYHAIITEDILDLIQLSKIFPDSFPQELEQSMRSVVTQMISWLDAMTHSDGTMPFLNDATNNISHTLLAIQEYAVFLEIPYTANNDELIMLPESGYYIYQTNEYKMIMDLADIGPNYQPGHAHADTFSFEVSIHKNKFIVNLGISSYQGEETRVKERGTSNHSTLLIDGKNSSDVWGEFRVGQRAKIISKNISRESNDLILQASHDGYKRIYGSPIHRREFVLSKKSIAINDSISGSGNHEVTILFHLHPEVIILGHDDSSIDLMHEELNITFNSSLMSSLQIIESMYAPEFGMQVPTKSIALKEKLSFPSTINSSFTW